MLTLDFMYEQFGTATPEETANLFREVVNSMITSDGTCEEKMLGEVIWLSYHPYHLPTNHPWALCDGSSFLKADYPDYWQRLVDTGFDATYETSGTEFRVPDLIGRFPLGTNDEPGGMGGASEVTITVAQMPPHTHPEVATGLELLAVGPGEVPVVTTGAPAVTGSTGGGQAHPNMPPFATLAPYIRLEK